MVTLTHTRFQLVIAEQENDITQGKTRTSTVFYMLDRTVVEAVQWLIMEEYECQLT
jgi:hypothetical protein